MSQNHLVLDRKAQLTRKDLFVTLRDSVLGSVIDPESESLGLMFYCNEVIDFCNSKILAIELSLGPDFTQEEKVALKALAGKVLQTRVETQNAEKVRVQLKAQQREEERLRREAEELAEAERKVQELKARVKPKAIAPKVEPPKVETPKAGSPKAEPRLDRTKVKVKKIKKKIKVPAPQVIDVSTPEELTRISQRLTQEEAIAALDVPDAVKERLKRQVSEGKTLGSGQVRPTGPGAPRPFPSASRMTELAVTEAAQGLIKAQGETTLSTGSSLNIQPDYPTS